MLKKHQRDYLEFQMKGNKMDVFGLDNFMKVEEVEISKLNNDYHFEFFIGCTPIQIGEIEQWDQSSLLQYLHNELDEIVDSYDNYEEWGVVLPYGDVESIKKIRVYHEEIEKHLKTAYREEWSFRTSLTLLYDIAMKAEDKDFKIWLEEYVTNKVILSMGDMNA